MRLDPRELPTELPPAIELAAIQLSNCIEENLSQLMRDIRLYGRKAKLVGPESERVVEELLNETIREAFDHLDRFDSLRQPMAWLLGIAANVVNRRKAEQAKQYYREVKVADLNIATQNDLTDEDAFDLVARLALDNASKNLEANEEAQWMLSLVSDSDRQILRLMILEEMDSQAVALALGIKAATARQRLHRALERLRAALVEHGVRMKGVKR